MISRREKVRSVPPPQLPFLPETPASLRLVAGLEKKIRRADKAVGKILEKVERCGRKDDTLVVFTTDHGIDFPRAKMTLYDPGIEAALIFWGAECSQGKRDQELHSHIDIMPTLLEYAGLEAPSGIQGQSFWKGVLLSLIHILFSGRKREIAGFLVNHSISFSVIFLNTKSGASEAYKYSIVILFLRCV